MTFVLENFVADVRRVMGNPATSGVAGFNDIQDLMRGAVANPSAVSAAMPSPDVDVTVGWSAELSLEDFAF